VIILANGQKALATAIDKNPLGSPLNKGEKSGTSTPELYLRGKRSCSVT
jgi:hypothetical protein